MKRKEGRTWRLGSMFSGCGGLDAGFEKAGFKVVWANDIDADACETYRKNIGEIIEGDINEVDPKNLEPIDVLAAGFPCQPFSNAGSRRGTRDIRGTLYKRTFDFIEAHEPEVVIYENVRGFLSFKGANGKLIDEIVEILEKEYGYHCVYKLLNFSHFGVPQNRLRVVLIAMKDPRYIDHVMPDITVDKDLSIQSTLSGLTDNIPNQTELLSLNPQAIHYGTMIPEGGSWKSLSYDVLPDRWKRIRDNMQKYHYPNFFRRYARTDVMGTITAAFKPENAAVWHPIESRVYSVREVARFQTFDDDFVFHGRSIKSKYQQIGNAVPPLFAQQLASRLSYCLEKADEKKLERRYPASCSLNVNKPIHRQLEAIFGKSIPAPLLTCA
ncbi:MAG: DNA cytosine methyltransferase [Planctomycetota bacterium]